MLHRILVLAIDDHYFPILKMNKISIYQEPITRSQQVYCVRVTAFSQTDLFLDWISREWDSHRSPMTNYKKLSWRHRVIEPELPLFFDLIRGKG